MSETAATGADVRALAQDAIERCGPPRFDSHFSLGVWARANLPTLARAVLDETQPAPDAAAATGCGVPLYRCGCGFVAYAVGEAGAHHDATRHILIAVAAEVMGAARASNDPAREVEERVAPGYCTSCGYPRYTVNDTGHHPNCIRLAAPAAPEVPRG